jgi:hypothetical protein
MAEEVGGLAAPGGGVREEPQPCRRRPELLDASSACAAPFLSPMRRGALAAWP